MPALSACVLAVGEAAIEGVRAGVADGIPKVVVSLCA
jgi:hypothetical protein